jgi:hypothetical protein
MKTRRLPTIKAAKGYCLARYGRLPRSGREMKVIQYEERCPHPHTGCQDQGCCLRFAHGYRVEVYLQNVAGSYKVREYALLTD